jgi:hypothetical protein
LKHVSVATNNNPHHSGSAGSNSSQRGGFSTLRIAIINFFVEPNSLSLSQKGVVSEWLRREIRNLLRSRAQVRVLSTSSFFFSFFRITLSRFQILVYLSSLFLLLSSSYFLQFYNFHFHSYFALRHIHNTAFWPHHIPATDSLCTVEYLLYCSFDSAFAIDLQLSAQLEHLPPRLDSCGIDRPARSHDLLHEIDEKLPHQLKLRV